MKKLISILATPLWMVAIIILYVFIAISETISRNQSLPLRQWQTPRKADT